MAKFKIRPLQDRIVVRRLTEEEKTAGGLIIPDTAKEKPQVGVIMAIGTGHITPDGKTLPMVVKVGQKVMYK